MDLETHKFFESRDVVFHEDIFPFDKEYAKQSGVLFPFHRAADDDADTPLHQPECDSHPSSSVLPESPMMLQLRRSARTHRLPNHLQDFVCCSMTDSFCSCTLTNLCVQDHECLAVVAPLEDTHPHIVEPNSYEAAVQHPGWQLAMEQELQALYANKTWEIVSLADGKRPMACKWVYKAKLKADGSLERLKARLVVKGFTQKPGIDYNETFSPVVKLRAIRAVLAVAVKKN